MGTGNGGYVRGIEYPAFCYSHDDKSIVDANGLFENEFSAASEIIGRPVQEIIQPILTDDFSWKFDEERYREYAFLTICNTRAELVELTFRETTFDKDIICVEIRALFSSGPDDLICMLNDDRNITRVNEMLCRRLGYKRDELLNMRMEDLTHPLIRGYTESKWGNFVRRGETRGEHLVKTKDGEIIFVEYRAIANVRLGDHLLILREISTVAPGQDTNIGIENENPVLDQSVSGIIFTDADFKLRYVNRTCLNLLGYNKKDILGKPIEKFCKSEKRLECIRKKLQKDQQWKGNLTALRADDSAMELEVKITPLRVDDEENIMWQGTLRDISARMQAEKNLSKSEHRFNRLLEAAPDGILIVDENGAIEHANPQVTQIFGYEIEELIGRPIEVLVPDSKKKEHVQYRKHYSNNPSKREMGSGLELYAKHKDGSEIPVDIMLGPFEDNGRQSTIAIVRDISKFRNTQQRLEQEKEFTKLLHRLTTIANRNVDLDQKLETSIREICEYMEWPVGHVYLPADDGSNEFYPSDIWHIEDEKEFESFRKMTMCTRFKPGVGMVGEVIESGEAHWYANAHENPGFVRRMPEVDLNIRACFAFPLLIKDEVMGVLEFFTNRILPSDTLLLKKMTTVGHQLGRAVERKKAESLVKKNMELFKQLFKHTPAGIVALNKNEKVINVNKSFTEIFGYTEDELVGKKLDKLIIPKRLESDALEFNRRTFGGEVISKESVRIHKDGTEIPVVIHTVPVTIDNNIETIFGIYVDLSKVKETENRLRESLEEKKFLLEEIHHRVKNNLAIITSLLELQINQAESDSAIRQLKDSQSRIFSMAMVHEHLYQMESFSCLELDRYLKKLIRKIRDTFTDPDTDIELRLDTDKVRVTLDQAIACGQLINELVTNSFKHAFHGADKGYIEITLHGRENEIELKISDSGPGLPEKVLEENRSSLGLRLVNALGKQLGGELEFEQQNGTTFILTFPKEEVELEPQ